MGMETFGGTENTEEKVNSLSNRRESFDLEGYSIELRNKQETIHLLEKGKKN